MVRFWFGQVLGYKIQGWGSGVKIVGFELVIGVKITGISLGMRVQS